MENKELITTYGKIILIGEHSVVYNRPAIAIPFNATSLQVFIEESNENHIICKFYDGLLSESSDELEGIKTLIEKFLSYYKIDKKIKLRIESTIPNERGMGSSAAASVGVAKALFEYFKIDYNDSKIKEWADVSEKIIHANPSGLDVSVVLNNKSIYYIKNKPFEFFPIDLEAYLIIVDSGKKGKTKEAVLGVANLIESDIKYFDYIDKLGLLTDQAKMSINEKDVEKLGLILNEAQSYLRKLTVSDESIEELVNIALDNGALGSKLTGGGRGGCVIALSKSLEIAENIKSKYKELGKNVWISKLKI